MKIHIVRHPQTYCNVNEILAGYQINSRITQLGRQQIERTARRLAKEGFEAIYSSDHTRCRQLALAVQRRNPKLKIIFAKDLRERDFGIFEGRKLSTFIRAEHAAADRNTFKPAKGESRVEAGKRLHLFVDRLRRKHKHILIVTHGGIKRAFLNNTFNLGIDYHQNLNTCVSLVDLGKKKVHYACDVSHLPKRMRTL